MARLLVILLLAGYLAAVTWAVFDAARSHRGLWVAALIIGGWFGAGIVLVPVYAFAARRR